MFNKKTQAFTMSEILIAMTIIAVLAVMTLPALISNSTSRANNLRAKTGFNNLANALQIASARLDYDLSAITALTGSGNTLQSLLTKTMDVNVQTSASHPFSGAPFKVDGTTGAVSKDTATTTLTGTTIFEARNGIFYIFPANSKISTEGCTKAHPCIAYIDVNGKEGPNTILTCATSTAETVWVKDTSFTSCAISPSNFADIYPIVVYDGSVRPANNAFNALLSTTDD